MVQEGGDEAGYEAKADGERRWQENTWFSDCASLVRIRVVKADFLKADREAVAKG